MSIIGIILAAGMSVLPGVGVELITGCAVIPQARDKMGELDLVAQISRSCLMANDGAKSISVEITRDAKARIVRLRCFPEPASVGMKMNFCTAVLPK